jgi:hypothetical protein
VGPGVRAEDYPNLISGLGRCSRCDGSLAYLDKTPMSRCADRRKYVYLRCTASAVGSCTNRAGFPYNRLEPMLFRLHDLTAAIGGLIPEHPDDVASKRVAESQAIVARKKQNQAALFAEFADHPTGSVRDGAKAEIEKLGAEIDENERELTEARRKALIVEHVDREVFFSRWDEAMAMIDSDDPDEGYLARAKFAQEFRRIIDVVELHDDRRITVRTKPDRHRWRTEFALTPQTVESVQAILPNGHTGPLAMEVSHGVVLVHPDTLGCDRMSTERLARGSIGLAAALSNKRIRVDRAADGNFVAVLVRRAKTETISSDGDQKLVRRNTRRGGTHHGRSG